MLENEKLEKLFWDCVSIPHKQHNPLFAHDKIRKLRTLNFNMRFIEILLSPDFILILKNLYEHGGDKYYLPTILSRLILKRREMGLYNELFERIQ